jgi:hypothetical protein
MSWWVRRQRLATLEPRPMIPDGARRFLRLDDQRTRETRALSTSLAPCRATIIRAK